MAARPGVVAVARAAGVSASTVSNVYNRPHVVSPELRERVLRAAAELGYGGPDPTARSLRSGRASALGVVIRERLAHAFEDTATVRVLQGVSDAADPHRLGLVIVPAYPEQGGTDGPAVRHAAVDGLILYSLAGDDPLIEATRRRNLPIVIVDSPAAPECPAAAGLPIRRDRRTGRGRCRRGAPARARASAPRHRQPAPLRPRRPRACGCGPAGAGDGKRAEGPARGRRARCRRGRRGVGRRPGHSSAGSAASSTDGRPATRCSTRRPTPPRCSRSATRWRWACAWPRTSAAWRCRAPCRSSGSTTRPRRPRA